MSGIAGIVRLDGAPISSDDLLPMLQALRRRGPDAQGWWADDHVGLVHTSLHTTSESLHVQQPLTHDNAVWISADARIDNRQDLRRLLTAKGADVAADASDADYILHAYRVWEKDCVDYLLGDFAFAIWDAARQQLFCARDGFGVRTFCYTYTPSALIFGSEVRAILAWPDFRPAAFEPRIADFLIQPLEGIDTTSTFYQDVYRLPPGHTLTVADGQISIRQYWKPQPQPTIRYQHDSDYVEAFLELFSQAVDSRLRAPSPAHVASMLSGGLNSSSVVGVARDLYRKRSDAPLQTLSAVTQDMDDHDPETHHINAVIAQGNLDPVRLQPSDSTTYAADLTYLLDHATNLFDHWMDIPLLMYIAAKHQGVNILLSGIGGDEFASLPPSYPAYLLNEGRFRTALTEMNGIHRFYAHPQTHPRYTLPRHFYRAWVPYALRARREQLRLGQRYSDTLKQSIISPDFAQRIHLDERLKQLWNSLDTSHFTSVRDEQYYWAGHPYLTVGLERYSRVAAVYGVEVRHPYTDRRLVEFLLALPWNQLNRHGWPKYIVRQAMDGILTDEVRFRREIHHLGWRFQIARYQLARERFDRMMQADLELLAPYVDISQIQQAYTDLLGGNETEIRKLWYALTLAIWLKDINFRLGVM